MIKIIKKLSLVFILSLVFLTLFSCKYIHRDRGTKAPHICSFDEINIVAQVGCTTDGIIEAGCICGLSSVEVTAAYGHDFGQWQMTANQTCSKFGSAVRICKECGFIQERVIEKNRHTYTVSKEKINGVDLERYSCKICEESFLMDPEVSLPANLPNDVYLFDRADDFGFVIISANDESYIRNNLKVFNGYYDYVGNLSDGLIQYELIHLDGFRWQVKFKSSLQKGAIYRVEHSDGIYFEDYGFAQMIFSVANEESDEFKLSDNIIYVADLESKSPGYYPYSFEYSASSGDYFLSLEKADGLNRGDIICIGSATCLTDVIEGNGNNTFGRIKSITTLNDGRTMILLSELTADELFSALNVFNHEINKIEELTLPLDVADRFKTILFDNEDFASLVSAMYTESLEYLEIRGFAPGFESFEKFLESITIVRESDAVITSADGSSHATATVNLKAVIDIPVVFADTSVQVGSLMAELTLSVNIDVLSFGLHMANGSSNGVGNNNGINISFVVNEESSSEIKLDIYSSVSYLADSTPYVFEVDTRKYHFANCQHISKETADKQTTVSVYSLLGVVNDAPVVSECEYCKPASYMKTDICVLDKTTGVYHNVKCRSCFSTSPSNLIFTEEGSDLLSAKGYTACESCGGNNDSYGSFETEMIDRFKNKDFGEYADEVMASVIDSDGIKENLYVGAFSTTICGIDREISLLSVSLNFRLEGSSHYSYKIKRNTTHGLRSAANGTLSFVSDFIQEIQVVGFISPAHGENILDFESDISLLIAGFRPHISD